MQQPSRPHLAIIALLAVAQAAPAASGPWRITHTEQTWQITGFDNDLDLSGIASANGKHCLIGSDESHFVQPGEINPTNQRITALPAAPLRSGAR